VVCRDACPLLYPGAVQPDVLVARLLRCRDQHVTACDSFHLTPLGPRSSAPPRQAPIVRCSTAASPASASPRTIAGHQPNPIFERDRIASARRECTDRILIAGRRHLHHTLSE
jgi:hypothetical protein